MMGRSAEDDRTDGLFGDGPALYAAHRVRRLFLSDPIGESLLGSLGFLWLMLYRQRRLSIIRIYILCTRDRICRRALRAGKRTLACVCMFAC